MSEPTLIHLANYLEVTWLHPTQLALAATQHLEKK